MNRTHTYQSLLLLLLVSGIVLISGCDVTQVKKEETEKAMECPVFISPFLPPKHCYTFIDYYPSRSPNGKFIAFLTADHDRGAVRRLYVYELSTQTKSLVFDVALNKSSQAWSPDGEWLTFSIGKQIYKIRPDGSELTRLTENDDRDYFDPAWSPDGEWIAYSDRSPQRVGSTGIWVIKPDGTSPRWIGKSARRTSWMPDGNLVVSRDRLIESGNESEWVYEIALIDSDDGSEIETILVDSLSIISNLDYSPYQSRIVFQSQSKVGGDINIWKINSDGTGLTRLTENGGAHPAWSPDGSTVAYVNIDYFEGRGKIWLMNPDGTNRRPMINEEVM